MLEDDIQYLGTRSTVSRANLSKYCYSNPFTPPQRLASGIALHVEKSADQPAYGMLYRRSHFNVVDIGRRPGGTIVEKRYEPTEYGRAMFRCPVISRRHAKITFSDCGHVYLTDLNSHHGTHILKPGEMFPRTLKPETPTVLADGDVITFGKMVGKDSQTVSPVVVRVELLYDSPSETVSRLSPLLPTTTPTKSTAESSTESNKSQAGRYGLYTTSSHNSETSSQSDPDSDIEELDGPPPTIHSPPRHISPAATPPWIPSARPLLPWIEPISFTYTPRVQRGDARLPSPEYSHPPLASYRFPSHQPAPSPPPGPSSPSAPIGFDAYCNDVFEGPSPSRFTSPMDLSSPSPVVSVRAGSEPKAIEPRHFSRSSSSPAVNTDDDTRSPEPEPSAGSASSNDAIPIIAHPVPEPVISSIVPQLEQHVEIAAETPPNNVSVSDQLRAIIAQLPVIPDTDIRQCFPGLDTAYAPSLPATVKSSQDQTDKPTPAPAPEASTTHPTVNIPDPEEEVKVNLDTVNALVDDMKALCEKAEMQIVADLEAVKAARMSALAAIASEVQTPLPTSLKRKRGDDEGEDVSAGCASAGMMRCGSAVTARRSMEITARSRKRARRLMSTVVQTATAVTVGAIVTWSALAFS